LFPEATILTDHILKVMTAVLEGLTLKKDRINHNLALLHGINMAESVMIELTKRGMPRQKAHEIIREKSMEALATQQPLSVLLSQTPDV
jgi:adenylosuccinate lyase